MTNCGQRALSEIGHERGPEHDSKIEMAVKIGVDRRSRIVAPNGIPIEKEGWMVKDEGIRAKEEKECG